MRKLSLCTVLCSIVAVLSLNLLGCAALEKSPNTAKLVTQYAVLKFAEQSSLEKRGARIENVKRVATDVKNLAAGESTTIPLLRTAVAEQIAKLKLSPADQFLANALVDTIASELIARVGDGVISPEKRVQVVEVMDWIIEATAFVPASS